MVSIRSFDGLSRRMTVPSIRLIILNEAQMGFTPAKVSKGTLALCWATSSLLLIMASLTDERWVVLTIWTGGFMGVMGNLKMSLQASPSLSLRDQEGAGLKAGSMRDKL